MQLNNTYIAENAETITKGAGLAGAFSGLLEAGHAFLGWTFSGQGLATISVLIAIGSSLIGIYFRKKDHQIALDKAMRDIEADNLEKELARRKDQREQELHEAKLRALKAREEEHGQSC